MKDFIKISQIVLVALLLCSIGFNVYYCSRPKDKVIVNDSIIIEKIDTICDTVPVLKKEKVIKYVTDTLLSETIEHDTVAFEAIIPITQKEYTDDSTYTVWVSGYKPNLDSIQTYSKTITIEKYYEKKRGFWDRFAIGPQVTAGYDVLHNKPSIVIGVGGTFNIFKKP